MTRARSASYCSSLMGRFTSPHHTWAEVLGSSTMNLSFGERPVCLPVSTTSAPPDEMMPS